MLDFSVVQEDGTGFDELVADLSLSDLENLTNEMIDFILGQIAECQDFDVTFEPSDPEADDPYAADPEDVDLAWNLGHVIVHVTASSEESAALAAELARGVRHHGRPRWRDRLSGVRRLASKKVTPNSRRTSISAKSSAGQRSWINAA